MSFGKHICMSWKVFWFWSISGLFQLVLCKKIYGKSIKNDLWGLIFLVYLYFWKVAKTHLDAGFVGLFLIFVSIYFWFFQIFCVLYKNKHAASTEYQIAVTLTLSEWRWTKKKSPPPHPPPPPPAPLTIIFLYNFYKRTNLPLLTFRFKPSATLVLILNYWTWTNSSP